MHPVDWYDRHAEAVAQRYESIPAETVHRWLLDTLPPARTAVLDVGAGSGRDAAWLAGRGYDVVAVEPSPGMLECARRLHADVPVHWIQDSLPDLAKLSRTGLSFNLILLSAVWMHVPPGSRERAFRKLINLLRPGGTLAITLRNGPAEPERGIFPVSEDELARFARNHAAFVESSATQPDELGRQEVSWTHLVIRLPDDGTGALPLLRHVILNDAKSATYKLALLRTLCRIADGVAGMADSADDEYVSVPLGLIGLVWLRLFMPLLRGRFPQSKTNIGYSDLGFVRGAFRSLDALSPLDLRVGMRFSGGQAERLHQALRDAINTVIRMPATYMTYPNGQPIVRSHRKRTKPNVLECRLDDHYLRSFGEMRVPRHLWQALQRFSVWVEPALVAEWARLIEFYAERQGRAVDLHLLEQAMTWAEPQREVSAARECALRLMLQKPLHCVWSSKPLTQETLDIDHCFPWSAWPCGDLWNLMPAHRTVNQHQKRNRLPSEQLLLSVQEHVIGWWSDAYLASHMRLSERFSLEAAASLPGLRPADAVHRLEELFGAVRLQRTRLRHDQQIPEWAGPAA
jgi:SAM-dependent methyltransferase